MSENPFLNGQRCPLWGDRLHLCPGPQCTRWRECLARPAMLNAVAVRNRITDMIHAFNRRGWLSGEECDEALGSVSAIMEALQ